MPQTIEWRDRPSRRRRFLFILGSIAILIFGSRIALSHYVDLLWFGSLGYREVFTKTVLLQCSTFVVFFSATFFILYGWFLALKRAYHADLLSGSIIYIGRQQLKLPVESILTRIVFVVSIVIAAVVGFGMLPEWSTFALYWYAPHAASIIDPIFGKPLDFYLFTLPAWQLIAGWLLTLAIIGCIVAVFFILITGSTRIFAGRRGGFIPLPWRGFSIAFAFLLLALAIRVYISRFEALFEEHVVLESGVVFRSRHHCCRSSPVGLPESTPKSVGCRAARVCCGRISWASVLRGAGLLSNCILTTKNRNISDTSVDTH
jgi:uncharacterized membrane protein (UPF0182 family)